MTVSIANAEFRELERLVMMNYNRIINPEIMPKLMDFLQDKDSLSEYSPSFIKRVAKVLDNLEELYPDKLEDMTEKRYRLNSECAAKIFSNNNSSEGDIRMGAHASSHASNMANKLYEDTNELAWKLKALSRKFISAQLTETSDKKYSSRSFYNVAKIANQLFNATGQLHFLNMAYNAYEKAAKLSENKDPVFSARMHGYAGFTAGKLFYKSGGEEREIYAEHALRPYSQFKSYFDANPEKMNEQIESNYRLFSSEAALITKIICEPKRKF
jgi:hypothetical protein